MKQSEKLTQLLELMQANPELPVIPCVDGDVVSGDEYYCWLGSWGESSTCYFGVAVMADDQKEAEYLGHEAGRKKHRECDEIEVVGVMPVISARNAGKGRLCQRIPLKERALKFVKEAIKNGRSKID